MAAPATRWMPTPVAGPDRRLSRWKFTGLDEENGLLSWNDRTLPLKGRPWEMPTLGDLAPPDLLNRFIDLASGNAAQIRQFAKTYGPLGPIREDCHWFQTLARPYARKSTTGRLEYVERVQGWVRLAQILGNQRSLASALAEGRSLSPLLIAAVMDCRPLTSYPIWPTEQPATPTERDEQKASGRLALTGYVGELLDAEPIKLTLAVEGKGLRLQPDMMNRVLPVLAFQLARHAANPDARFECSHCGAWFQVRPGQQPRTGSRAFCPECRTDGVPRRLAQRDYRRRLATTSRSAPE